MTSWASPDSLVILLILDTQSVMILFLDFVIQNTLLYILLNQSQDVHILLTIKIRIAMKCE